MYLTAYFTGAVTSQSCSLQLFFYIRHSNSVIVSFLLFFVLHVIGKFEDMEKSQHTLFRPCIDIHQGQVKQIVGGTLGNDADVKTNYVSLKPSSYYAELYKLNHLEGAHVIMLGPNCEEAAKTALHTWPGALQIGGGINISNAQNWLQEGASKVNLKLIYMLC